MKDANGTGAEAPIESANGSRATRRWETEPKGRSGTSVARRSVKRTLNQAAKNGLSSEEKTGYAPPVGRPPGTPGPTGQTRLGVDTTRPSHGSRQRVNSKSSSSGDCEVAVGRTSARGFSSTLRWQRPLYENPKRHLECGWKRGDSAVVGSTTRTDGNAAAYDRSLALDRVGRPNTDFLLEENTGVCRLPLVGPGHSGTTGQTRLGVDTTRPSHGSRQRVNSKSSSSGDCEVAVGRTSARGFSSTLRWQRPLYENPKRHLECGWKRGDSAVVGSTTRTDGNAAAYDRSLALDRVGRPNTDFLLEENTGVCRLPLVGPGHSGTTGQTRLGVDTTRPSHGSRDLHGRYLSIGDRRSP